VTDGVAVVTPQARDDLWAMPVIIGFSWLLQALCLRMWEVRIYAEFFGFRRDDGFFRKNKVRSF
jgi:hypothetical protein